VETSEVVLSGESALGEKSGESVLESALRLIRERSEVVGKERIRGGKKQKKKGRGRNQLREERNALGRM
jgi:hypothetical protein